MADDQEQLRQHWQQLAEQLGLDASGQPAPASAPVPIKEEKPTAAKMGQAEKAAPSEAQTEREETLIRNEDKGFGASEAEAPAKAPAADQFVAVAEASAGAVLGPPEPSADEPRPERRGRRERRPERGERGKSSHRRRDSGGRRREETPSPVVERAENSPDMNGPEDSSEPEFPEEIEPAFVDETPSAEERKQDDEADTDDVDTLSDWNVPSWAELIASLYRPER